MLASSALAATLALTACLPPDAGAKPSDPPVVPTSSATPPAETPDPTTAPAEKPTPVAVSCDAVISAQAMYDFNPNFGLLTAFSPTAGSFAARAVADKGTACRWVNQTSGVTIDFGVSSPGPTALAAARDAAASGTAMKGLGDAAYFSAAGGTGTVQVVSGERWITLASAFFSSPEDAADLAAIAVKAAR